MPKYDVDDDRAWNKLEQFMKDEKKGVRNTEVNITIGDQTYSFIPKTSLEKELKKTREETATKIFDEIHRTIDIIECMDTIIVNEKAVDLWTPKDIAIIHSIKEKILEIKTEFSEPKQKPPPQKA